MGQVHGARVMTVDQPGGATGEPADGAVTSCPGAALAVLTADCAPVVLASPEGLVGVAHAGWKGLRAGVVEATVQSMRRMGATRIDAVIGPCIHPCCYTFGADDLMQIESRLGRHMRASDREGRPALDLPAGVRAALHAAGATLAGEATSCTGCSEGLWSWRTGQTSRRPAGDGGVEVVIAAMDPGPTRAADVGQRLLGVRARIRTSGGDPERLRIVAVTKGFGPAAVEAARRAGLIDMGENYAQELLTKAPDAAGRNPLAFSRADPAQQGEPVGSACLDLARGRPAGRGRGHRRGLARHRGHGPGQRGRRPGPAGLFPGVDWTTWSPGCGLCLWT